MIDIGFRWVRKGRRIQLDVNAGDGRSDRAARDANIVVMGRMMVIRSCHV